MSGLAYTNSISGIRLKENHGVVHLPQETVREYSYEEYSGDTNNLDNVHHFRTRGTVQHKNMKLVYRASTVKTLTDFIQEAVHILNTYEDTDFEDFFHVLDTEIRKYNYRGCKFSELTQNSDTRSLLAGSLKLIRGKPVSFTKANINEVADMLRDETYDKNVKDLLDYINSLYTDTELNFHSVLNELKYYRNAKTVRTHNNLVQVIRGGLRAVLFNPYTELNTDTRRELKDRIDTFWKQFKNNPASSAEMNDIPNTDPVIKSVSNKFKVSENIMNEVTNPEPYSKNGPQIKSKHKREKIVSIETYNERFQDVETEKDESSNESGKQITNYNTDEISSGQSFDSSSNSIKNSQERHVEYNTERYMTLYTEEISYTPKTISTNVVTKRPKVKKRPTTTSTPRESDASSDRTAKSEMFRANIDSDDTKLDNSHLSHGIESGLTLESKHEPRAIQNYDKPRNHGKADNSRSNKKHKDAQIISQYNAVIDVQLANTELFKSLGMSDTVELDTNSRYDTTLYLRSAIKTKPVSTRTAPTKPPSRYLKSYESFYRKQLLDELNKSIMPNKSHSVKPYKKHKKQNQNYIARRSYNDTNGEKDINNYVITRIKAIEKELKELKQINDFSFRNRINDNNTNDVKVSNVTDKYEVKHNDGSERNDFKRNVIERLLNQNHDLISKENNDRHSTKSHTMNTKSTTNNTISSKSIVIKKDAVNATVVDNKNTSQVTNNNINVTNNIKEINEEVITNNATSTAASVTNTIKLESVVTTPTAVVTMAYEEPSYDDYQRDAKGKSQLDPFGLMSDGFIF